MNTTKAPMKPKHQRLVLLALASFWAALAVGSIPVAAADVIAALPFLDEDVALDATLNALASAIRAQAWSLYP